MPDYDAPAPDAEDSPTFSVVIPLEFHRDRWERCLQAWMAQTIADSLYELILVIPTDFAESDRLADALQQVGCVCRVVVSDLRHDVGLSVVGAEHARGKFLFFTESHCWPEPDVLALCLQAFDQRPDWAALSCRSLPVASNRMAKAEAEMYDSDITHGMTAHPWRKILDQCFVTRRSPYEQSGGFKPEFGHFAEWALAATYFELGLSVGYLPQAGFHHQYVGDLRVLRHFTQDFVRGEIRYLTQAAGEPGWTLIAAPNEWISQGNFERPLAKAILQQAIHDVWRGTASSRRQEHLTTAWRWLGPAVFGDRLQRFKSSVGLLATKVRVRLANLLGPRRALNRAFKTNFAAMVHCQRLSSVADARWAARPAAQGSRDNHFVVDVFAPSHAGLHAIEELPGTRFRWSEPAAMMRIDLPAGEPRICIDTAPFFALTTIPELRFQLGGKQVPAADVLVEPFRIVIETHVAKAGATTLRMTCSRFPAAQDPRRLGIPISKIGLEVARPS